MKSTTQTMIIEATFIDSIKTEKEIKELLGADDVHIRNVKTFTFEENSKKKKKER